MSPVFRELDDEIRKLTLGADVLKFVGSWCRQIWGEATVREVS